MEVLIVLLRKIVTFHQGHFMVVRGGEAL